MMKLRELLSRVGASDKARADRIARIRARHIANRATTAELLAEHRDIDQGTSIDVAEILTRFERG